MFMEILSKSPLFLLLVLFGLLTGLILCILLHLGNLSQTQKANELPGPALLPFVGRIHDLPIEYMWLKFKEWADEYGPIYRTRMLSTPFIVISDENIAEELLVRRAKINSDRPGVKSLFDSKSTYGSTEYLPLMGRNSKFSRADRAESMLIKSQSTGRDSGAGRTQTSQKRA